MSKISSIKNYKKQILMWIVILIAIVVALRSGIDEKIVVFVTLVLGVFTQIFAGLGALIALVPFVGPLIIKVLTIPIFWVLNAMGYVVSGVAIKKGYAQELAKSRIVTLGLLIGIIIGYIIGHIVPLR
ncbi:MAG: hypothetical protein HOK52_05100 [Candidatus Marinimicrobia bacterium]|jgi:fatty acid desaturase|nr:hypothetical protein [Candidatus Neomarinimicrobiota bacterium]MBT6008941.1 hypothetical protein [Rhodobacterales bacterium]MBT3937911.1 hypothetical protein [Candidatus Neomarinimicrobiota bacterium]MBT3961035.1 hypothetical protein [Candidatus Neomarinimicrobiota bacterium]MBT4383151.1 hypothetical protein [Candidatus Neomarinimicrobiota bacterium]|tara:strand:- start:692 stop:1075 length:384 start_codon:yes stop_codon:yes gene_type:complete